MLVWIIHSSSVTFMTGLIWLIQGVQYPLFAEVGPAQFPRYHALHAAYITWIVGPVMAAQLVSAILLSTSASQFPGKSIAALCLGLTFAVFTATAFLSVPLHTELSHGLNPAVIRKLVFTNWLRTLLWSAHALLCGVITFRALARSGGAP